MARFSLSRIVPVGALVTLTVVGGLALPDTAKAGTVCGGCIGAHVAGQAQMMMGAAAVGALAASAASGRGGYGGSAYDGGDCFLARRQAVDEFGNLYVGRVRVCQ